MKKGKLTKRSHSLFLFFFLYQTFIYSLFFGKQGVSRCSNTRHDAGKKEHVNKADLGQVMIVLKKIEINI